MMEPSEENHVGVESSEEEGEAPPKEEEQSECGHGGGDDDSPAHSAEADVTVETDQSKDVSMPARSTSTVVVLGSNKIPASEKFQRVRKWSINKFKCTRQALSEKLGRGSKTVDLELEPRLDLLKDDRQRYDHMTKLAQSLANQLAQFSATQKSLGDAFTELSSKSPELHVEFGVNAEAQKHLSKSTEALSAAVGAFTADMNTLVNKTMEDTMINAKQYEAVRIEYDAYRVDLEELNMEPRDADTLPKLEDAQKNFQAQRDRYQKVRDDLSVKVKLLEENRVKVLHNHLWLLHSAMAADSISCHSFLQQNMRRAESLHNPSLDASSWLEEDS
ncbi:arfaptin-1-like isoform X2 [Oryzias latipes]|nr:arfaptin-1-like isoform X2 [Oryzias latipes]XP_020557588.1 arfaptin-1-like isoform X2 [Oryzias latipes]XP_023821871.1 arfaptin-1-like isoform X2 [Oryzias latipes]